MPVRGFWKGTRVRILAIVVLGVATMLLAPDRAYGAPKAQSGYVAVSPTAGTLIADNDFEVKRDGFSFANWGGSDRQHAGLEVTTEVTRRILGDDVCARIVNGRCHLSAAAEVMQDQFNSVIDGGHCLGMASVSALAERGMLSRPLIPGATAPTVYGLPVSRALDALIAQYAASQIVEPVATEIRAGSVREVLSELEAAWAAGTNYVLAVQGDIGGHAVVPIALRDLGAGRTGIVVYDNNYPGEQKVIVANSERNTWYYTTALNPADRSYLFGASPQYPLELVPLDVLTRQGECPICKDVGDDDVIVTLADSTAASADEAATEWDVRVTAPDGSPIRGAASVPAVTNDSSETVRLPGNRPFVITMSGVRSGSAMVDVGTFGDGWISQIKGVQIPAGATVRLSVNADGTRTELTSTALGSEVQMNLGTEGTQRSTIARVAGLQVRAGMPIVGERRPGGLFRFTVDDILPNDGIRMRVKRTDDSADAVAMTTEPLVIPGRSVISIPTENWNPAQPLRVRIVSPLSTRDVPLS